MSGHTSSRASKFTDQQNEINDLVSRLQVLLPQLHHQTNNSRKSVCKILRETCCYIKKLQKEVEDLSEKLTNLMDSVDISDIDRRALQGFLQQ